MEWKVKEAEIYLFVCGKEAEILSWFGGGGREAKILGGEDYVIFSFLDVQASLLGHTHIPLTVTV